MVTKTCPVQRLVYGHMFLMPVSGLPKGLLNGGQQAMEPRFQNFAVDNHELEIFDKNDYTFYCKFCGQLATQYEWAEAMTKVRHVGG